MTARSINAGFVLFGILLGALFGALPSWGPAHAADEFIEGQYWALIIGINVYPNLPEDKQLTASRKDAEAVAALLRERYGFAQERMIELYDEGASRRALIKTLTQLKRQLAPQDSLFVYYAGHGGYEGRKGKGDEIGYWVPSDAELLEDPSSSVFNTQMRDFFAGYPARHIFLISDSVFSNSLMGKTGALVTSKFAVKELYRDKSRWVLVSGGNYPVPDLADKAKKGHSLFAWHLLKVLEANTAPYLLGADLVGLLASRVTNEKLGKLPRSAPIIAAGDEGGQFVFRLLPEYWKKGDSADAEKAKQEAEKAAEKAKAAEKEKAKLEAEKAKVDAAQRELEELELQLKKAEESLKGKKP